MSGITIEVTDDTADRIVLKSLFCSLHSTEQNIVSLKRVSDLDSKGKEELDDSVKIRRSIRRIIRFYSTYGSRQELAEMWGLTHLFKEFDNDVD